MVGATDHRGGYDQASNNQTKQIFHLSLNAPSPTNTFGFAGILSVTPFQNRDLLLSQQLGLFLNFARN